MRSLSAGGYEVRNKDASAGVVQAFRPMTGAFSKPGYGHRVTVTVEDNRQNHGVPDGRSHWWRITR